MSLVMPELLFLSPAAIVGNTFFHAYHGCHAFKMAVAKNNLQIKPLFSNNIEWC